MSPWSRAAAKEKKLAAARALKRGGPCHRVPAGGPAGRGSMSRFPAEPGKKRSHVAVPGRAPEKKKRAAARAQKAGIHVTMVLARGPAVTASRGVAQEKEMTAAQAGGAMSAVPGRPRKKK